MEASPYQRMSGLLAVLKDTGQLHQFRVQKRHNKHTNRARMRRFTTDVASDEPSGAFPESVATHLSLTERSCLSMQSQATIASLDDRRIDPRLSGLSFTTSSSPCQRCKQIKKKCDRSLPECFVKTIRTSHWKYHD